MIKCQVSLGHLVSPSCNSGCLIHPFWIYLNKTSFILKNKCLVGVIILFYSFRKKSKLDKADHNSVHFKSYCIWRSVSRAHLLASLTDRFSSGCFDTTILDLKTKIINNNLGKLWNIIKHSVTGCICFEFHMWNMDWILRNRQHINCTFWTLYYITCVG